MYTLQLRFNFTIILGWRTVCLCSAGSNDVTRRYSILRAAKGIGTAGQDAFVDSESLAAAQGQESV